MPGVGSNPLPLSLTLLYHDGQPQLGVAASQPSPGSPGGWPVLLGPFSWAFVSRQGPFKVPRPSRASRPPPRRAWPLAGPGAVEAIVMDIEAGRAPLPFQLLYQACVVTGSTSSQACLKPASC